MPYHIDEENSELAFEVREGNKLVIKIKSNIFSDSLELYLIKVGDNTEPTDKNVFSSLRVLKEIENLHDTILKEINSVTSGFWELKQDSQGNEYIATKYNVLTEGGLTTYGLGEQKLGTIYDGLPIDNDTIYWEEVEGSRVLKAKGSGGSSGNVSWGNISGKPTWIGDNKPAYNWSEIQGEKPFYTKEEIASKYVTIDTEQEITALKHFTAGLSVGESKKKIYEENGVVYIDADVAVTGAMTFYASAGRSVSTIMDGVTVDEETITKGSDNVLRIKNAGAGSSFDGNAMWSALSGSSDNQINKSHLTTALTGYATESWVSGKNYAVKATTLAGYGITDAYTKSESDSKYPTKTGSGASGTWGINISGNASNADKLDGTHKRSGNTYWGVIPYIDSDGTFEVGKYIDFHNSSTGTIDYSTRLQCDGDHSNTLILPTRNGNLALLSDNVASATKLQTARTIWGQSFDGTNNVTGNIDIGNNDIIGYAGARIIQNLGSNLGINPSGYVGIGTTSPSYKLHVNGGIYGSSDIRGARYILEDNTLTGLGSSEMFTSNLSSIRYSSDGIYVNGGTFRPIIRWGDIVNGRGYHTRYVFGSARDDANDWGRIFMAVSNNDAGTSTGCSFSIYGAGYVEITGNILATGGSSFYGSDIRYKSIIQQVKLSLLEIANAPSFIYRWNKHGMNPNRLNLGGSAQYAQKILPWAVNDNDNFLSMDYATVAYTFAVHTARHLLTYETRTDKKIKKLENRVKYLEKQLKKLGYEEVRTLDDSGI